jgi:hypothetical protein
VLDAALVHLTPEDILRRGLPFPYCDGAIVAADALGEEQALAWLRPHVRGELVLLPTDTGEPFEQQIAEALVARR